MKINKLKIIKLIMLIALIFITNYLCDSCLKDEKKKDYYDKIEYQYIAIINNEEVVANYCNVNGSKQTYCKFNDYTYYNVPFKKVEKNRIKNYYFKIFEMFIHLIKATIIFLIIIYSVALTLKEKEI